MLADNLETTANNLIDKYGSTVIFTKDVQDSEYDPETDSYSTTTVEIITKGVVRKPAILDDKSISKIVKVKNIDIDINYQLDGNNILKIENIKLQDKIIAKDIYI